MNYRVGQLVRIVSAAAYPGLVGRETVILRAHDVIQDCWLTAASDAWARAYNLEPIIFSGHNEAKREAVS